jgi:hypothetical protein
MPYVGGQMRIESLPGVQKARMRASIAWTLPVPRKMLWSGVRVCFCLVWVWRRSG